MNKWLFSAFRILTVVFAFTVLDGWLSFSNPSYAETERLEDIPYANVINVDGDEEVLDLDVYLPEATSGDKKPAIIWFHGGGFASFMGKRQIYILMLAEEFAKRGYVNISVEYRRRNDPRSDMPGAISDAVSDGQLAVAWIIEHADQYNIDTSRLVIGGGSAGGILVGNLVHSETNPLTEEDGFVAVLNLWGPISDDSFRVTDTLSAATPPTLLLHGTADKLIDYHQSEDYQAQLEDLGVTTQLNLLEGGGHPPMSHMDEIYQIIGVFLKANGA